jgi:hypothetical protein
MALQTLLIEGAMISLDKAILLGVMWITNKHGDSHAMAEAHESGGKVTALSESLPKLGVPIQRDGGR